ncbi:MAG: hypothetical protein HDS95_03545 [Bacteroidales bacterium]|nr:hypothetical protein [Bacteroidales bacterium]MBD5288850.1 hypothetical protein [Bacteroides sp.]MDE6256674.1 hypothetical protein [Muribaculaceae bacterium]
MKRKKLLRVLMGLTMVLGMSVLFTSCDTDDYWYDGPGWNDGFYDGDLNGYWELVQANSVDVVGYDKNYLYFNGRGRGLYYFWDNGRRYIEDTYYDCQYSNSGTSDYQINLQYGNGRPTTMNYWFTHGANTLWLQWRENGRVVTYVYDRINGAPWM